MRTMITGYGIIAPSISSTKDFERVLLNEGSVLKVVNFGRGNTLQIVGGLVEEDLDEGEDDIFKINARVSKLAIKSVREALNMSGLSKEELSKYKVTIVCGTSAGGCIEIEENCYYSFGGNVDKLPLHALGYLSNHSVSSCVAYDIGGVDGEVITISSGCTAGIDALSLGKLYIESGKTDICIISGADTGITTITTSIFEKLGILNYTNDLENTGRPFDKKGKGMTISESSGALIIESEEIALRRGVKIYAEVESVMSNNDNKGANGSDIRGIQMLQLVKEICKDKTPTYVNSQALGVRINDKIETIISEKVFENKIPYTSIKGVVGHSLGASGIIQIISSIISIENDFIPKAVHSTNEYYPKLPLVETKLETKIDSVLITSHGYGGNNTCCLIKRVG